ncbi:hypothetical protein C1637_24710 [Chryseobacterium lactis]|uniref:Lipoprotein n=1 Tax=Chryseobacterium lactis TaxID=1241981 RepID=A0A3G6RUG7_CHRLC|nr:hypothetical protein [Chryseobacterium lactis]AZA81931.1 hypothetical protein EG342_08430 [Chryseobacterium lactis]AZB06929.1 hypothetical protein EG341_24545 [Chryseobacterium lactis]PNW10980.1 hypothetical protein C1637_24710 [Chryseobacterium lactis]
MKNKLSVIIVTFLVLVSCQRRETKASSKENLNQVDSKKTSPIENTQSSQKINESEWQGTYHFETSNRDEAKTAFNVVIKSLDNISIHIDDDGDQENYSNIKAEIINKDKIKIIYNASFKDDMGTIYIEKSDDDFYISGNPIYFINPGNNEMPLNKIK